MPDNFESRCWLGIAVIKKQCADLTERANPEQPCDVRTAVIASAADRWQMLLNELAKRRLRLVPALLCQGGYVSPVSVYVWWLVCQQDYTKTGEWISTKRGSRTVLMLGGCWSG